MVSMASSATSAVTVAFSPVGRMFVATMGSSEVDRATVVQQVLCPRESLHAFSALTATSPASANAGAVLLVQLE